MKHLDYEEHGAEYDMDSSMFFEPDFITELENTPINISDDNNNWDYYGNKFEANKEDDNTKANLESYTNKNCITPKPFLRKGQGKSLVISNTRKKNEKISNNSIAREIKQPELKGSIDEHIVSNTINKSSQLGKNTIGDSKITLDDMIHEKLSVLDKQMERVHQAHQDLINKKKDVEKEQKQLVVLRQNLENKFNKKYEKITKEFEDEKKRMEDEKMKMVREKIKNNELITRLKMEIKRKDIEIQRLLKEIRNKEKSNTINSINQLKKSKLNTTKPIKTSSENNEHSDYLSNQEILGKEGPYSKIDELKVKEKNFQSYENSYTANAYSLQGRDQIIQSILESHDFEKDLDELYGLLSSIFLLDSSNSLNSLPPLPINNDIPWCNIETPYEIDTQNDMQAIIFYYPSGLIEIAYTGDNNPSKCPKNTRRLIWKRLNWCILVYPNGDIKGVKPDKDVIYHYIKKNIVQCTTTIDHSSYEKLILQLNKFYLLKQRQCIDLSTGTMYIQNFDGSTQIIRNYEDLKK
ncbi:uncharacterized protein CMU_009410 [Cryptosporidium muris RN66]|uniref:Uncharacterized protein n=1 Tax=Cryptosporidium muris (strain RN66) TaxID=441375 RepID=B6AE08_CRYMR|nr:uncharacterized protein CMU_009410 [Cryptosporidium muris RN66]EEA06449.1 hypothetical protein, conserved [Cryptosporidium muris RN66]|eukprot:XP_002140798.1 hypothetical protein [Cryptosporidium muris RN66]